VFQFHDTMVLCRKGIKGAKSIIDVTYKRVCETYFSIMHQLAVMGPYVKKHFQELWEKKQNKDLITKQQKHHFTSWLKDLNG
jgi:hypothetical protein